MREDRDGSSPPELVVRQEGEFRLEFYLLSAKLAFTVIDSSPNWDWFDPTVVQYLYEPGPSRNEPPKLRLREIKMITTVSPDPQRYKEFSKSADVETLYFPLYSKEELVAIGTYMREKCPRSSRDYNFVQVEFSVEAIQSRFNMYGGVFRRVLPGSLSLLMRNEANCKRALADAASLDSVQKVLATYMRDSTGSYLVQWSSGPMETKHGTLPFRKLTVQFTSEHALTEFRTLTDVVSYEQLCMKLLDVDKEGMFDVRGQLFQRFVVHYHKEKSVGGVKRICPNKALFAEMSLGTIYHPVDINQPAFDAYYKDLNGYLVLIQCSWTKEPKVCKHGAFAMFLRGIEFDGNPSDIRVVYTRGDQASKWQLDCAYVYSKTE
jgi:hypothetical protein